MARERQAFRRLAVFAGGCTPAAAQAVCGADARTLGALVDKGLLGVENDRRRMLETIREYAQERLDDSPEAAALRERHALHFLELAERAAPELRRGTADARWLEVLDLERANLRTALAWMLAREDGERAQRLVCALFRFWHDRGPHDEACDSFARALALPSPPERRAAALCLGSIPAWWSGETALSKVWAEEGHAPARRAGDLVSASVALLSIGIAVLHQARDEEARARLEEALETARASGDTWAVGVALFTLLNVFGPRDAQLARRLSEEAGRLDDLNASTASLLEYARGWVAEGNGDLDTAATQYRRSYDAARAIGFHRTFCAPGTNLGWIAYKRGDVAEATALLSESAVVSAESGVREQLAVAVAYLAVLVATHRDPLRGAELRGAIERYRETVDEVAITELHDGTYDPYFAGPRAAVGEAAWAAAFERGRALMLDEAARLALAAFPTR
jgi:Tfp pilus assembly protein PilF